MRQHILMALMLFIAAGATAAAQDAPSMWMEQNGDTIALMVNTSTTAAGANAWVHFDPASINITDVDLSMSPWVSMAGPGWSHQVDHVIISLVQMTGVAPGEYQIAEMSVSCVTPGESQVSITKAEPAGAVYPLTYVCGDAPPAAGAVIAIGDASGTTSIPITITDAVNAGAMDITLSYDPMVVNVTGVMAGDTDCVYTNLEHAGEGWVRFGAVQGGSAGISGAFTVITVDLEPVADGMSCPLEVSVTTFKDATPDGVAMLFTAVSGTYTSPVPVINGDANDDGTVDLVDATYIARHVIGIAGYEVIDVDIANVNGDAVLDMADSMYLTKHVTGIAGFEVLR